MRLLSIAIRDFKSQASHYSVVISVLLWYNRPNWDHFSQLKKSPSIVYIAKSKRIVPALKISNRLYPNYEYKILQDVLLKY